MPQEKLSITERLEIYAEAGETSAPLKLWISEISKLEKGGFSVEKIASIMQLRAKNYEKAHFTIDTTGKTPYDIVKEIIGVLNG